MAAQYLPRYLGGLQWIKELAQTTEEEELITNCLFLSVLLDSVSI